MCFSYFDVFYGDVYVYFTHLKMHGVDREMELLNHIDSFLKCKYVEVTISIHPLKPNYTTLSCREAFCITHVCMRIAGIWKLGNFLNLRIF